VFILVKRTAHGLDLLTRIGSEEALCVFGGDEAFTLVGGKPKKYKLDQKRLPELYGSTFHTLISTSVFDEGIDLQGVGAVILAGAGKDRIGFLQRIGRGLRKKRGQPNRLYVLDFYDKSHRVTMNHSKERNRMYQEIEAIVIEHEGGFIDVINAHHKKLHP
jgi:superfamily II DNA or RNA helicase